MDKNGFPKHKRIFVNGKDVIAEIVGREHHILATGRNLTGNDYVNACNETPSDKVCSACFF